MKALNFCLLDYTTLADNTRSPGRVFSYRVQEQDPLPLKNKIEQLLDKELRKSNLALEDLKS